jgi:penicillin-insensitive murein DD-endopeptidase
VIGPAAPRRGSALWRRRDALRAAVPTLLALLCHWGCSSTPTPLAPHLIGSIGSPAHGVLAGGAEFPMSGRGFRWLNPAGHHFGLPRFINAVARAAAEVDRTRPGGAPLMVGDLSKRTGGQIPRHASHRTGRDIDLLFYAETLGGEPLTSPGFFQFGADGIALIPNARGASRYVRLDVEREWLLIKSLLGEPDANVQWMFISAPVEALITEYARARGEEAELVWHAESVMLQPKHSLPHDDHLHLRTACTPEEAVVGCEGGGPYWSWLPALPNAAPEESDDELTLALLAPIETDSQTAKANPFVKMPPSDEGARGLAAPAKAGGNGARSEKLLR